MNQNNPKSRLQRFYALKECETHGDAPSTTWDSAGAVLLAAVFSSSRSPEVLSNLTGFPPAFTTAVTAIGDSVGYFFSE